MFALFNTEYNHRFVGGGREGMSGVVLVLRDFVCGTRLRMIEAQATTALLVSSTTVFLTFLLEAAASLSQAAMASMDICLADLA